MDADDKRRHREDSEDLIPRAWDDANFGTTPNQEHVQPTQPPQKYREWLVSRRTRRKAHEALPLYRIPQRAYLKGHMQKYPLKWATDQQARRYLFVPKDDEAYAVLHDDMEQREWLLYVVLLDATLGFPVDQVHLVSPMRKTLNILYMHHVDGAAVAVMIGSPALEIVFRPPRSKSMKPESVIMTQKDDKK